MIGGLRRRHRRRLHPVASGSKPSSSNIPASLLRACVELAKDWRTDRYLRRLEAMMLVADKDAALVLTGNGDVLEPARTAWSWASARAATTPWPRPAP